MSFKNLYCIHTGYGHFITHPQCQRHINTNNIKKRTTDTLWTYKYILFFIMEKSYTQTDKDATDPTNWVHGKNQNSWNMNAPVGTNLQTDQINLKRDLIHHWNMNRDCFLSWKNLTPRQRQRCHWSHKLCPWKKSEQLKYE